MSLRVGTMPYDTTDALLDGRVTFDGVPATVASAAIASDLFRRMVVDREFDVAELGLTVHLRLLDVDAPFVAIPAFPARVFRHSCVYVHTASGIERPEDLAGRTVGEFGMYGQDSGVWVKGVLADEYGVTPDRCRWVIGGLDRPAPPFDFVPHPHPDDVHVERAPAGRSLGAMLESGEIDALVSSLAPQCALDGSPHVRRLFEDFETVERDYHRRTGIFPIMHTVVLPRELVAGHPGLARTVYEGYLAAKEAGLERYRTARRVHQVRTMLPWTNALVERTTAEFGADWWPYGIAANRTTLDAFLRHHHEQGLSRRRLGVEDVFVPELLDT
ncbi:4,5-dihydroxyphthalate decarboxylase [Actinomycetospora termitidis]|uniref:4,5-dihydroxyphthalate decarboxylase n=1 Tax=Actinomycetospora termitidis TaxID=3053470 RepID=A0ABT7M7X7_9PSEU|nr:4,5-dihydroxyphthalate decarboxylase [Actinomycetospora sp. Odt1-22]MDL5156784.1 4,5-dihydroxyphthalate decarboxylase [Actinomycetospora sp. Odt1-22]